MSKIYFRHGAMNSAKSAALIMAAHNYTERGKRIVISKPSVDTKSPQVSSRIGIEANVDWVLTPETSYLDLYEKDLDTYDQHLSCIFVDEAQFLTPTQVDELLLITIQHAVPVIAYGLRTDFLTHAFEGSRRLLEVASEIEELITVCRCEKKAKFNGRHVNGVFVREGESVAIDGQDATYESLCPACYYEKVGTPTHNQQ